MQQEMVLSPGRMSLPWIQYSAQVAYTEEDRFQFRETNSQDLYSNFIQSNSGFQINN